MLITANYISSAQNSEEALLWKGDQPQRYRWQHEKKGTTTRCHWTTDLHPVLPILHLLLSPLCRLVKGSVYWPTKSLLRKPVWLRTQKRMRQSSGTLMLKLMSLSQYGAKAVGMGRDEVLPLLELHVSTSGLCNGLTRPIKQLVNFYPSVWGKRGSRLISWVIISDIVGINTHDW